MIECHISERVKGQCDRCRQWPEHLHMPEALHGWYCPRCCPIHGVEALRAARRKQQEEQAAAAVESQSCAA